MMDQFVVWNLRGARYLCLRDADPVNYYFLMNRIKRLS